MTKAGVEEEAQTEEEEMRIVNVLLESELKKNDTRINGKYHAIYFIPYITKYVFSISPLWSHLDPCPEHT